MQLIINKEFSFAKLNYAMLNYLIGIDLILDYGYIQLETDNRDNTCIKLWNDMENNGKINVKIGTDKSNECMRIIINEDKSTANVTSFTDLNKAYILDEPAPELLFNLLSSLMINNYTVTEYKEEGEY